MVSVLSEFRLLQSAFYYHDYGCYLVAVVLVVASEVVSSLLLTTLVSVLVVIIVLDFSLGSVMMSVTSGLSGLLSGSADQFEVNLG